MEARIDRIETRLDQVADTLSDIKVDVAVLKERVSHLPTKGWAVTAVLLTVTLMAALIGVAPVIQSYFGTAP
jgi:hypothetical protein